MEAFNFLYDVILPHVESVTSTLQRKCLSAAENQIFAGMALTALQNTRNDDFKTFS